MVCGPGTLCQGHNPAGSGSGYPPTARPDNAGPARSGALSAASAEHRDQDDPGR